MNIMPQSISAQAELDEARVENAHQPFVKLRVSGLEGHRLDFPGLANNWHYLDTAATAQKPQVVIDAMSRAMGEDYATVHRGVYARSANMTLAFEAARRRELFL